MGGHGSLRGARTSCPPEREARTTLGQNSVGLERAAHADGQDVRAPVKHADSPHRLRPRECTVVKRSRFG